MLPGAAFSAEITSLANGTDPECQHANKYIDFGSQLTVAGTLSTEADGTQRTVSSRKRLSKPTTESEVARTSSG